MRQRTANGDRARHLPDFAPMGRIFEVRKHTMFARWDRMAKQFSRIAKEIIVAVKAGGADPNSNPALRRAVQNARQINMPKDKVESAIKRAVGKDATNYELIIYEGYAQHGVALIFEAATDNPTRTVASMRTIFQERRQSRQHRQRGVSIPQNGRIPPQPGGRRSRRPRALSHRSWSRGNGRQHRRER
jgi:hypothetical protein